MSSCKPTDEDFVIAAIQLEADVCQLIVDAVDHLPVTGAQIAKETSSDQILRSVLEYTQHGWPTKIVDTTLQKFYRRRDAITIVSGCLCYSDRIIIPLIAESDQETIAPGSPRHRTYEGAGTQLRFLAGHR